MRSSLIFGVEFVEFVQNLEFVRVRWSSLVNFSKKNMENVLKKK
jgi:hypothetical protein